MQSAEPGLPSSRGRPWTAPIDSIGRASEEKKKSSKGGRGGGFTTRAAAPPSNFDLVWRARLAGYAPASIAPLPERALARVLLLLLEARRVSARTPGAIPRTRWRRESGAHFNDRRPNQGHLGGLRARVDSLEQHAALGNEVSRQPRLCLRSTTLALSVASAEGKSPPAKCGYLKIAHTQATSLCDTTRLFTCPSSTWLWDTAP